VGGSLWPQGTAQTTHECRERIYLTERVKVPKGLKPPKIQKAQNRLQKSGRAKNLAKKLAKKGPKKGPKVRKSHDTNGPVNLKAQKTL
jgi:hypothetical protein